MASLAAFLYLARVFKIGDYSFFKLIHKVIAEKEYQTCRSQIISVVREVFS